MRFLALSVIYSGGNCHTANIYFTSANWKSTPRATYEKYHLSFKYTTLIISKCNSIIGSKRSYFACKILSFLPLFLYLNTLSYTCSSFSPYLVESSLTIYAYRARGAACLARDDDDFQRTRCQVATAPRWLPSIFKAAPSSCSDLGPHSSFIPSFSIQSFDRKRT